MRHSLLLRLRRFCAFATGFVFFLSGILKLMDPTGAGLVVDSYLKFLHIGFIDFAAKGLGVTFALAEAIIGSALVTGVFRPITGAAALVLQGFFTLLTLALVIFNPEMDCGCFGEAVHLTHWQTFIKNIIICCLLAVAFIPLRNLGKPKKHKFVSFGLVAVSVVAFTVYSLMYIPVLDFTDFKPAARLRATVPESDETEYEAVFTYEKDGIQQTFTLSELPDSTWNYISTETVKKSGGMQDNTPDLSIYDESGRYLDSLAIERNVMIVSIYNSDMSQQSSDRIRRFITDAQNSGFRTIVLSGTSSESSPEDMDILFSDIKTLMTLNRSNGGVTWFDNGTLIRKWANRDLPTEDELKGYIAQEARETQIEGSTRGSMVFQGFLLYVFAVMLLL
jgi:hypothetical protein